jgi:hypothetical protein
MITPAEQLIAVVPKCTAGIAALLFCSHLCLTLPAGVHLLEVFSAKGNVCLRLLCSFCWWMLCSLRMHVVSFVAAPLLRPSTVLISAVLLMCIVAVSSSLPHPQHATAGSCSAG